MEELKDEQQDNRREPIGSRKLSNKLRFLSDTRRSTTYACR